MLWLREQVEEPRHACIHHGGFRSDGVDLESGQRQRGIEARQGVWSARVEGCRIVRKLEQEGGKAFLAAVRDIQVMHIDRPIGCWALLAYRAGRVLGFRVFSTVPGGRW
jgi:hypothetical protein